MKNIILTISLISIINYCLAQKPDGFHAGFLGGLVASQVDGDNYAGYDRPGIQFGGFTNFMINEDWGGQVEIKYIQKGSKNQSQKHGIYFELKFDYIEVPLLVNYQFDEKISFEGGFGVAYLIRALEDKDGDGFLEPEPPFENYELNAIIGANYKFSDHFIVNAKYSYSILPIRPHPGNQTYYSDRGSYNNLLSVALYYMF